ncbi:hypothetical protein Q7C_167 [Methylophaga frappieri]|uniref:Uncharacterized protein n=1 Tax=Methylophaga frappieri (strain ATCC BAA-2434 / DSM 25690 / JAM7) TaxID=754477 RepID=I1YEK5_METFJ|nr:putative DNA-binding domain-containing protein [Methylophaga frappieri]AFJ01348.1 hypothetical protein Q7C_167 [Methylophaga frappieri]
MDKTLRETQMAFAGHLRNPDVPAPAGIEDRRLAIYRRLIYNNIESFCSKAFPVIKQILSDSDWHAMIRDFIVKHRCQAPLFNEIAREFLAYLDNERDGAQDPPFLRELAHYEWVELALNLSAEPYQAREIADDAMMATVFHLSPLAWTLRYQFPVHQIGPDNQPTTPLAQPVFMLVYRNANDAVKFIELNPVSARLIELLGEGMTGNAAANQIAETLQHPNPAVVREGARQIIADWLPRGILI